MSLCAKRTLNGIFTDVEADVTLNWHRFQLRFLPVLSSHVLLFYALQMRIKLTKGNFQTANEKHGKGRDEQKQRGNRNERERETEEKNNNPIHIVEHIYLNGCRWKRLS